MGKSGETNGVEELLEDDDVGGTGCMAIQERVGVEEDVGVGDVVSAPASPCPTEVIDNWNSWRDDELYSSANAPPLRFLPVGSVAPPGSPVSVDGDVRSNEYGLNNRLLDGAGGVNEGALFGNHVNMGFGSHEQTDLSGLLMPPDHNIPTHNNYFGSMTHPFVSLEGNNNNGPGGYFNFDTNAPPVAPQLSQQHPPQQPVYMPRPTLMESVPSVSNFAGAPVYYAVNGNYPAGQFYGGTILNGGGGPFSGATVPNQPVIFVQQPVFPQQQSLLGMPQQVMVDQYGNTSNPRDTWDSLIPPGCQRVNDFSHTEYHTAYGGSGPAENSWNHASLVSDSSTYYSYAGSVSTSELSSIQSLSPTKTEFSSSTDASFSTESSTSSSNQTCSPVAWTQHPTFPASMFSHDEYQANAAIFSADAIYGSSTMPITPPHGPAFDSSVIPSMAYPHFGAVDDLSYASIDQSKPTSTVSQAPPSSGRYFKGRGQFSRNKKSSSDEQVVTPTATGIMGSFFLVDCGYTFFMNGAELPFIGNIWSPAVASMMIKLAPPRGYDYYVPPCVNDGDFFGGQLALWQVKMIYYFGRFRPDNWRIQAVPDISRSVTDGWFNFEITSKLRFCCRNCKMPWTTKKGKITFLFKRNPETQTGYIFMKMFRQVCMKQDCPDWTVQTPACYPEEIERAVSKLFDLVSSIYYGAPLDPSIFTDCQKSIRVGPTRSRSSIASKFQEKVG